MICRRAAMTAAAILLLATAASCEDALMGRYDPWQTGYTSEKLEPPLKLDWEYAANKYDNNPASCAVADGACYFACGDRVYAVDIVTGALRWKYPVDTGLGGMVMGTPAVSDGMVYFGSGEGNLYCIDAETGHFQWAYQTRGTIRCPPVITNEMIYFGSDDNALYGIEAGSGDGKWSFVARDDIANGVAVGAGMAIVSCMDGNMYGVNASSGKLRWMPFRLPQAPTRTHPVITENVVVMAVGNIMYGLSARSGQQRWAVGLEAEVAAAPAVDGPDVYVPCRDQKIYAYTAVGRQVSLKWTEPADLGGTPMSSPTIADHVLYATASRGTVAAFSTVDGSLKWRYAISPSAVTTPGSLYTDAASSPVVAEGALLVLTDDGVLHCFRPESPDSEPPMVFSETPSNGKLMSGSPPIKMSAVLYDIGSGVDFSTVSMQLDGQPLEHEIDYSTFAVSYHTEVSAPGKPVRPLKNGVHTIKLAAKDYAGNLLTKEWYFIADSSIPPPRRITPETQQPGKKEREPSRRPTPPMPTFSRPSRGQGPQGYVAPDSGVAVADMPPAPPAMPGHEGVSASVSGGYDTPPPPGGMVPAPPPPAPVVPGPPPPDEPEPPPPDEPSPPPPDNPGPPPDIPPPPGPPGS